MRSISFFRCARSTRRERLARPAPQRELADHCHALSLCVSAQIFSRLGTPTASDWAGFASLESDAIASCDDGAGTSGHQPMTSTPARQRDCEEYQQSGVASSSHHPGLRRSKRQRGAWRDATGADEEQVSSGASPFVPAPRFPVWPKRPLRQVRCAHLASGRAFVVLALRPTRSSRTAAFARAMTAASPTLCSFPSRCWSTSCEVPFAVCRRSCPPPP